MSVDYISDCIRRVSDAYIMLRIRVLEQPEITVHSLDQLVSFTSTVA